MHCSVLRHSANSLSPASFPTFTEGRNTNPFAFTGRLRALVTTWYVCNALRTQYSASTVLLVVYSAGTVLCSCWTHEPLRGRGQVISCCVLSQCV
jgi:hypothetical protein